MKIPREFLDIMELRFPRWAADFALEMGWIDSETNIESPRFLKRSIAPHLKRLSDLFNRKENESPTTPISDDNYWNSSSNPKNLRLAYFLYFMPFNLMRSAGVFHELARYQFQWPGKRALDLGCGFFSVAAGYQLARSVSKERLPELDFIGVDQNGWVAENGKKWATHVSKNLGLDSFAFKHFQIDASDGLGKLGEQKFDLITSSFFLNEISGSPDTLAKKFLSLSEKHLNEGGIWMIVEPALRDSSRMLLQFRKLILEEKKFEFLLPCHGSQPCGALEDEMDWCHDSVRFRRSKHIVTLDDLTGMDHRELPFTFFVIRKKGGSKESFANLTPCHECYRLVSSVNQMSKRSEIFVCGKKGKFRTRVDKKKAKGLERGDFIDVDDSGFGDAGTEKIVNLEDFNRLSD